MLKMVLFAAVISVSAIPANAQSKYPSAEIFGGYSYLNIEGGQALGGGRHGLQGAGYSFTANLTKRVGVVADFSNNLKNDIGVGSFKVDVSRYYVLFGPRFSWRTDEATVFGHALAGVVRTTADAPGFAGRSDIDFAMGFGGGVDLNANKHLAIRLVQADYLPTRVEDFGGKEWAHQFRVQAGIVIKLGN